MGKKRKPSPYEVHEEVEKTLYHSFVGAANSVSQLYTQAAQQQRKAASSGARQALERVINHLLKDNSNGDSVSRTALLQFLQQEYEIIEGSDAHVCPSNVGFPCIPGMPGDEQQGAPKQSRLVSLLSPGRRSVPQCMDVQEEQVQQQQAHQQMQQQQQAQSQAQGMSSFSYCPQPMQPFAAQRWTG